MYTEKRECEFVTSSVKKLCLAAGMCKPALTSRPSKTTHQVLMPLLCWARTTWCQPRQQRGPCTSGPGIGCAPLPAAACTMDMYTQLSCLLPPFLLACWKVIAPLASDTPASAQVGLRNRDIIQPRASQVLAGCCAPEDLCSRAHSCSGLLPGRGILCWRRPFGQHPPVGGALWPAAEILACPLQGVPAIPLRGYVSSTLPSRRIVEAV